MHALEMWWTSEQGEDCAKVVQSLHSVTHEACGFECSTSQQTMVPQGDVVSAGRCEDDDLDGGLASGTVEEMGLDAGRMCVGDADSDNTSSVDAAIVVADGD